MIRVLKILGLGLAGLVVLLIIIGLLMHKSRPSGIAGKDADALAQKMIRAVNGEAWDTTQAVSWNFDDRAEHVWDKDRHYARVRWGDHEVLVNINKRTGVARTNGAIVAGEPGNELVQKAWHKWANDSFWLNPVTKAFDSGTERRIVEWEGDPEALMVTYTSGGATPGDSYVWRLDDEGRPTHWNMWVNILPVGGLEFTWEDWIELSTGAKVASLHKGPAAIHIKDIVGGKLSDIVPGADPFRALEE